MAKLKIFFEGYVKKLNKGWKTNSTCCYVESDGNRIIIDPGCNRELLQQSLSRENLKFDDINYN